MGALGSKIGWEDTDAAGNPRSFINQLLDPIGACFQPAAFNLYDPGEHLVENDLPDLHKDSAALDDPPMSPPVPSDA